MGKYINEDKLVFIFIYYVLFNYLYLIIFHLMFIIDTAVIGPRRPKKMVPLYGGYTNCMPLGLNCK